jgi:hypothetical protein
MTRHRHSHPYTVRARQVPRLVLRALLLAAAGALTALAIAFAAGDTGGGGEPARAVIRAAGDPFHQTNSPSGAILTITGLKPGGTAQQANVTITNDGGTDGTIDLSASNIQETTGINGGTLAGKVHLVVDDITGATTNVYTGGVSGLSGAPAGTLAAGQSRTYRFAVSIPDGGTPTSNTGGDNAFQGAVETVQFDWHATGPDPTTTPTSTATNPPPTDTGTAANNPTFTPSGGGNTTPPNVTLGGSTTQFTTDGYSLVLACSQACTVNLGGTATVPGASKVYRLSPKVVRLRAGVRTTVKVKFPRNVAAAVKKAINKNKRVTVKVKLNIRNAAGASRNTTRTIVLKKKPGRR